MKIHLAASLLIFLKCTSVYSQETCEQLTQPGMTVSQFVEAQTSKSRNSFSAVNGDRNKCFPEAETVMLFGGPVCYLDYLNNLIPVKAIAVSAIQNHGAVEAAMYGMRGTQKDLESALTYFNKKYLNVTDEYLKNMKGPRFFGATYAWKNGSQYIVLGQHEPGYDPVEMSLHLAVGSKNGIEFVGTDLNTCK